MTTSLLYFLLLTLVPATVLSATDSELRSLYEFKKGIQTDPLRKVLDTWTDSSSSLTLSSTSCPPWTGVYCNDAGNVVALSLDGLALGGELKLHTLTGLTALQNLTLSNNDFTGRVPPALGAMSSLQHLDLSRNRFYGPIPARINDLWGLNYLNLSGNLFKGGFPGPVSNLNQLKVLDVHSNRLWGHVSELLHEFRNVEYVDLSDNEFFGGIELNVSSLSNTLRHLNLSHNNLTGGFLDGESMELLRNLQVLDLGGNQIAGELPSFGSLSNLKVLRLGNNQLFGKIPEELLESSIPVEELDLSGNAFTGSITGINSTTLKVLNLSSNGMSGTLQNLDMRSSVVVDLSQNKISGDISMLQNMGAALEVLDFSSNNFSGSFTNLTLRFEKLTTLRLSGNLLVGSLPSILKACPRLSTVDLSQNEFSGSIPGSFFSSLTLTKLNLSQNHLDGPIPVQGGRVSEFLALPPDLPVESVDLSNNSLSGSLPRDIGNMVELKLLNVAKNQFSGELPSELSKLGKLEYLDLSGNKFKGAIPNNLPSSLTVFNVSYNELSGPVPENLKGFPLTSFHPGNELLNLPNDDHGRSVPGRIPEQGKSHTSKAHIRIAIIVASVGVTLMIGFVLLAYHQTHHKGFHGRSRFGGDNTGTDVKIGRFTRPSFLNFHTNVQPPPTSLSFSNDHLLTSQSRSLSGQTEFVPEIGKPVLPGEAATSSTPINLMDSQPTTSGRKSSPGSPLSSSPRFFEAVEQPVILDVYSPDRLAGELLFLDASLQFTAEELSRAPAEVLGRSSHGTLYKATLDSGHMLTVKWLRVGLVKHKKDFAKEVKRIGSVRHPNIVPLRAYYWGPREQERLLLADYVQGDSLALHLYESTPRRYSPLSFNQRLKVAIEVARCLLYLHDRGMPHGNLKPTNVILAGPEYHPRLTDYSLHRLMTPAGVAEQLLNMGALGYRSPELATAAKPVPSFKADVYGFGVILMEMLTRRSAGDIISGQSGAVDLTDWVRLCDQEGRGMDCIDRDIAGGEEPSKAMDELLAISLRCILPVNERPNIRQVFDNLCSISL
ncbi:probable inactive receptor kinase At5g10020 [Argentina anserina]|uniref:probable inactive receptor kinase At5g10020 n=1 Tax=Argentina anserina TaxID=57926 RepID=UPI0021768125|nr:probable inactive receptor kinase At5g10020 [Potentilla anserina]